MNVELTETQADLVAWLIQRNDLKLSAGERAAFGLGVQAVMTGQRLYQAERKAAGYVRGKAPEQQPAKKPAPRKRAAKKTPATKSASARGRRVVHTTPAPDYTMAVA